MDARSRLAQALRERYRIQRELGQGGMATVYLADDLKHHRAVAIKVFRPEVAASVGAKRFLREIEIAAQLQHPHILTLIDSGEADGILYYVMPYVEGESLRTKLAREDRLSIRDAVRMLRDVADGLAEAHRHGLVHRDVKPDNVMISGNHAVVADFGVAKAVSSSGSETQSITTAGISLGTPTYMSPEQASAEGPIDHRTDIYSFGVMAYELLTGSPPFVAGSAQAVLAAHLTVEPTPVSNLRADTPPALEQLIMRCLAKKREDRWQSTDELLQRLEAMTTAGEGVPPVRGVLGARGRQRLRMAVMAVPIVLLGAAALVVHQRRAAGVRLLSETLLPVARAGRLDEVYDSLQAAGVSLGAGGLRDLVAVAGATLGVTTDPTGATVTLGRLSAPLSAHANAEMLGRSPLPGRVLVAGSYRMTLSASGYADLDISVDLGVGDTLAIHRALVPEAWGVPDMAVVDAGRVVGPLAPAAGDDMVPPFLIDRHEVTNEAFSRFVAGGGYADPSLWPDSLVLDGRTLPRAEALARFVDRTGLPGPRTWTGGTYPPDRGAYPVTGVSWYEAAAFARWSGKSLPTWRQWWRAALGDVDQPYPWGHDHATLDDRSNFGMVGTSAVDRHPDGVSPYGAYDMAGNVREWLAGEPGSDRFAAAGGSWQDPTYAFYNPNVERFAPGFASDAIGFRLVEAVPSPQR
ncbi:MAG: bifunctional serine/threonine-protein kinase/formylglycine-generating enzyme family protein [Gemmatimonadota bacterium]|jgi:tRNA A-37 threonylcarbamoyl transferase component Bud32